EGPGEYGIVARTGAGGMTNGRWTDPLARRAEAAPARTGRPPMRRPAARASGRLAGPVGGRRSWV
ncbi:MAG TPA: hypothetical protein VGL23_11090, partial [Chloroflexota bacterium]